MHVHQSIVDKKTGQNIFSKADGEPSDDFYHYIGGLQRYIPSAMVLVAPYVNSYRRLSRNTAAPINIEWGYDNRTVGIRPSSSPRRRAARGKPRDRCRCQPLHAMAMTLACGYLGMKNKLKTQGRDEGRCLPGAVSSCRAAWARRLTGLPANPSCTRSWAKEFVTIYSEIKERNSTSS
ncbi:MAG: hypothetical protein R3E42_11645 [Burkholderiaceae bacterium]